MSPSIRIAHLLDGAHFGGAEQVVRLLARHSPRFGIDARVYLLSEGRLSEFLRAEGVPIRVFRARGRFDLRPIGAIARAAREDGVQIIHAHASRTHLMARLASRRLGIRNLTHIHSPIALDENVRLGRHSLRAWVERAGRSWTDQICSVSREEAERLVREERAPAAKVAWVPNAVERVEEGELAPAGSGEFTVAMIAQLRPRKGPEVLIRAFGEFARGGGSGRLVIIGDDEFARLGGGRRYLDELRGLAREQGAAAGRIEFAGFQAEPWRIAAAADVVCLPSLFGEGLPLTLLEAMNRARAVFASDSHGNRECVANGETGRLHPPGDWRALAAQLAEAAADRPALAAMGRKGRALFLRQFDIERVMPRWAEIYGDLASPR